MRKSGKITSRIIAAVGGLVLSVVSGCMQVPQAGDFPNRKISVAFPHHPAVMLINAGEYDCKRIENTELRGIDITKDHWHPDVGKTGNQKLYAPDGAEKVGIKDSPELLFEHNFFIGYNKDINRDGIMDRVIDQYKVSWDAKKSRLADRYIYNTKEQKFIRYKK